MNGGIITQKHLLYWGASETQEEEERGGKVSRVNGGLHSNKRFLNLP